MKNLLKFLIVLAGAALICGLPYALLLNFKVPVVFPHIQLPAEPITGSVRIFGIDFFLSNTLLSVLLADVILIVLAVIAGSAARRRLKQYEANPRAVDAEGDDLLVPKGWLNTFEAILEYLYNLVETIVGSKWAGSVFPIAGTIFLLVLVANYLHFVPLVDAFGYLHCTEKGFPARELGDTGIYYLAPEQDNLVFPAPSEASVSCGHSEGEGHSASPDPSTEGTRWSVVPFLRTAATDLNLTFALALVSIITVQVLGVRKLGFGYFSKFFNLPALSKGFLGWIDLIVSWLEIVSEFFKTVSLSFRLFGNITAGAVLLAVMAFLIPVGAPIVFYLLEVLIGAIQAFIFFMLTTVFVAVAQAGHGDHGKEEHH